MTWLDLTRDLTTPSESGVVQKPFVMHKVCDFIILINMQRIYIQILLCYVLYGCFILINMCSISIYKILLCYLLYRRFFSHKYVKIIQNIIMVCAIRLYYFN